MDRKSEAYDMGWDAYWMRFGMASNPCEYGTKEYSDWYDGYHDAKENDELEEYDH